jgi:hypothetical protein
MPAQPEIDFQEPAVQDPNVKIIHPSLEARGGVDPESDDYWHSLAETRGD